MEESLLKQKSNTKVVQDQGKEPSQKAVCQLDMDATSKTKKNMDMELMKHRVQPERDSKIGKCTVNPNPSRCDPFITTEPSCQGFYGQASLMSKEFTGSRSGWKRKAFRNP